MYFRGDWTLRVQENTYHSIGGSSYYDYYYPEGKTTQIGISQVISRNSTDSPIFPARGSSFSLLTDINGGPKFGGATQAARFHKHIFSADWYVPLVPSGRITLMNSSTIGFIFGFERNSYIPYQDLFYMGGTGLGQVSVIPLRGYDDRSIGPFNGYVGGKAMIKHTTELRFALTLNPIPIYTLLFAEAGNVWIDHSTMDALNLRRSAGIGVRLLINPIGLIGFDYGYGYDAPLPGQNPPGWKFHLQFGKTF
jgi:outer membrane protein insertion porin family